MSSEHSLSKIADRVARENPDITRWQSIRDICDQISAGELSTFALDMVTDMTQKRITNAGGLA